MLKSTLALIILLTSSITALAETTYFIQIWTTLTPEKVYISEGDTPGGVEIYKDTEFVACALAFTVKDWDGDVIAPFSYGFMSKYPLSELKITTRGALRSSLKLETKETRYDKPEKANP